MSVMMTVLAHGAPWLVRPRRADRDRDAGRTAYPLVRAKDLSAIPVCGQTVRPLASQVGQRR